MALYDQIVDSRLSIRRVNVTANSLLSESESAGVQLDLFAEEVVDDEKERRQQEAILSIRKKFGKNAILKGMNFEDGATTRERNEQIGGHKS